MTDRKDFKRRVRERQAETGESYMVAKAAIENAAPAMDVVEMIDVTEHASRLGYACPVSIDARIDAENELRKLRRMLSADDAAVEVMRDLALANLPPPPLRPDMTFSTDMLQFWQRVRRGIGGTFGRGRIIVAADLAYMVWPLASLPQMRKVEHRIAIGPIETFVMGGEPR